MTPVEFGGGGREGGEFGWVIGRVALVMLFRGGSVGLDVELMGVDREERWSVEEVELQMR